MQMRSLAVCWKCRTLCCPKLGIYGSDQRGGNGIVLMAGVNLDHQATPQIWHL